MNGTRSANANVPASVSSVRAPNPVWQRDVRPDSSSWIGRRAAGFLERRAIWRAARRVAGGSLLFRAVLCGEGRLQFRTDQVADHPHRPRRIQRRGPPARCSAARFSPTCAPCSSSRRRSAAARKSLPLHLPGHMRHFVQRRRDQAAQTYDVHFCSRAVCRIFSHGTITPRSMIS